MNKIRAHSTLKKEAQQGGVVHNQQIKFLFEALDEVSDQRDFLDIEVIGLSESSIIIRGVEGDEKLISNHQLTILVNTENHWSKFSFRPTKVLNIDHKEDKVNCFTFALEGADLANFSEQFNQLAA